MVLRVISYKPPKSLLSVYENWGPSCGVIGYVNPQFAFDDCMGFNPQLDGQYAIGGLRRFETYLAEPKCQGRKINPGN